MVHRYTRSGVSPARFSRDEYPGHHPPGGGSALRRGERTGRTRRAGTFRHVVHRPWSAGRPLYPSGRTRLRAPPRQRTKNPCGASPTTQDALKATPTVCPTRPVLPNRVRYHSISAVAAGGAPDAATGPGRDAGDLPRNFRVDLPRPCRGIMILRLRHLEMRVGSRSPIRNHPSGTHRTPPRRGTAPARHRPGEAPPRRGTAPASHGAGGSDGQRTPAGSADGITRADTHN